MYGKNISRHFCIHMMLNYDSLEYEKVISETLISIRITFLIQHRRSCKQHTHLYRKSSSMTAAECVVQKAYMRVIIHH
jgi:hypothetical protein